MNIFKTNPTRRIAEAQRKINTVLSLASPDDTDEAREYALALVHQYAEKALIRPRTPNSDTYLIGCGIVHSVGRF